MDPAGHAATHALPCLYGVPRAHVAQSLGCGPLQLPQLSWHASQTSALLAKKPSAQLLKQSASCSSGDVPNRSHDVQLKALPKHVAQVPLQLRHCSAALMPSYPAYLPIAQPSKEQVPSAGSKVLPWRQEVHPLAPPDAHVWHDGSHCLQAILLTSP